LLFSFATNLAVHPPATGFLTFDGCFVISQDISRHHGKGATSGVNKDKDNFGHRILFVFGFWKIVKGSGAKKCGSVFGMESATGFRDLHLDFPRVF
jgi:hypothetical protein